MSDNAPQTHSGGDSIKRPRPVLSCLECRRKKLKCDRRLPCQQCRRSGRSALCSFSDGIEPVGRSESGAEEEHLGKRVKLALAADPTEPRMERPNGQAGLDHPPAPPSSRGVMEDLQARVARLEEALSLDTSRTAAASATAEEADEHHRPANSEQATSSRYHANQERVSLLAPFPDAQIFLSKLVQKQERVAHLMEDLETLNRAIKSRNRPRQAQVFDNHHLVSMLRFLPERHVCEKLVDLYFDNCENWFRILHRPTFDTDCNKFWEARQTGNYALNATLPTLLVVLSVASILGTLEECDVIQNLSVDTQPSLWETVQTWLGTLSRRQKYTVPILQLNQLMLLPQHGRTGKIEDLWMQTGQVVRLAMVMGMHRSFQGSSRTSVFEQEMRRRLWSSIAEQDLAISLMAGMPTQVSPENFISSIPANLDDADLRADMSSLPMPKPQSEWTDTLCQTVLAQSLPCRLSAYRYVTDLSTTIKYNEVLGYTRKLETLLQDLPEPLRFNSVSDGENAKTGRLFARIVLDLFIRRLLLNLYTAFALAMPKDDSFKEARIGFIQSCLVLLCYQDLFDPKFSELVVRPEGYWDMFYRIYRFDIVQTCLGLCLEIRRLTDLGSGTSSAQRGVLNEPSEPLNKNTSWTKATLIKAVDESIEPIIRRISRPGTDAKDLLCMTIALHSAKCVNRSPEQRQAVIQDAVSELVAACQRQMQKDGYALSHPEAAPSVGSSDGFFGTGTAEFPDFSNQIMNFDFNMATFPNMKFYGEFTDSSGGWYYNNSWS